MTNNTITPTIIENIDDVFGRAESKLEELATLLADLNIIKDEIESVVDDRYTTMFSNYLKRLNKDATEVERRLETSIAEVDYAIENNRLKTADDFYVGTISPHNEAKVEFYANLGSLAAFRDYIHENDPLAFDDDEDLEAFWEFAVEGRFYEKYGTYKEG